MKTYTAGELNEILRSHNEWLHGKPGGCRADLRCADLYGADLRGADLRDANLCRADLRCADLYGADLRGADLRGADLRDANLCRADLRCADLYGADLRDADLYGADLSGADLRDANLRDANLYCADLRGAKYNELTAMYALACPEVGSFIGWKKARGKIIKLEICEDAHRSSATTRKCRCSAAKVLAIENADGTPYSETVSSNYDPSFVYTVGEMVSVNDFDMNRWNECSTGIHFFITREEAVNY